MPGSTWKANMVLAALPVRWWQKHAPAGVRVRRHDPIQRNPRRIRWPPKSCADEWKRRKAFRERPVKPRHLPLAFQLALASPGSRVDWPGAALPRDR